MKKSIVISESQFSKLLGVIKEQEEVNPLFKTQYNANDKSILVSYFLLEEKPNTYVVVNPKEFLDKSRVWADGADVYKLNFDIAQLPKSQVEIVGEINDHPKYKIFKIPYWLYKKEPKLEVKRIDGFKRHSSSGNEDVYVKIGQMGLLDAFEALGGDFPKIRATVDRLINPTKPKEVDPSVKTTSEPFGNPFGKPYWGD